VSRIVITTLGSLGDLHPKIGIALELHHRGHDVVFATHAMYEPKIVALGLEFQPIRPDFALNPQEIARMTDLRTGTRYVVNWVCARLRETYADLLTTAQGADLILAGELVYATRLVAETLNIPWVLGVLQPTSFFSAYDPPVRAEYPYLSRLYRLGPRFNRGLVQFAKFVTRSWAQPIYELRAELGLPPLVGNPMIDDKYSPDLVLALFSPVLVQPQPDWAANTITTGFIFYDGNQDRELAPELQQFLDEGAPPIVFTLGSTAVMTPGRFYQESLQAAQRLNRRAVLLIGKNPPPANLPKDMIAVDYAPYSRVFPWACAIVHQGGIGTTAQALVADRPTLIMPYSYDQPDNAARTARLGTSRTLSRRQYSAPRVAQELDELLTNPSYAARAGEVGGWVRSENGVDVACTAIEQSLIKTR
jgi:rhamnosyltransferase subunit B